MFEVNPISEVKSERIENAAAYIYTWSVALSPLGPVFHYTLWGLCLVILIAESIKYHASWKIAELPKSGKKILLLLLAATVWPVFAGFFTFDGWKPYGHNVTPLIELCIGAYFAARFYADENRCRYFVRIFCAVSTAILLGNFLRAEGFISDFPNHALKNGNSLGALALMVFPFILCAAAWSFTELWKRALIFMPCLLALIASFSLGAWGAAFIGGLLFLFYALKYRKIRWAHLFVLIAALCICLAALNIHTGGELKQRVGEEFGQANAIHDVEKFTTQRNYVWLAAFDFIFERPVLGNAGTAFVDKYEKLRDSRRAELKLPENSQFDHPHSTYLYLAYIGGLPTLILCAAAFLLCLKKMYFTSAAEKTVYFPWGIMSVIFLVEIMAYATNGDIIQGRRDISVMTWCFLGIMAVLPEPAKTGKK